MKRTVILMIFLFSFCIFSKAYEYAVVKDARGYTEVMENSNTDAKIRAKLKNNTLVRIKEISGTGGEWVKISTRTEYIENTKYAANVDGYVMKDKLSYEFGPLIYAGSSTECDNTRLTKLVLKNKMDYDDFSILADYVQNVANDYEKNKNSGYSVKRDSAEEHIYTLKINNGLELKLTEDYDIYISGLKYKKISIDNEKIPVLDGFVPDMSISGVNSINIFENKNYTIISIPMETKVEGCSIESGDKIFIFKDNNFSFTADMIYENISSVREFGKWIKVKEENVTEEM